MAIISFSPQPQLQEFSKSTEGRKLNPLVEYDPVQKATTHGRWATIHQVAAIVCAVAFIALSIFVMIMCAEAPLIPIFVLSVAGAPLSFQYAISPFCKKMRHHNSEYNFAQKLVTIMKGISNKELGAKFTALGIQPGIDGKKLKPLIARYELALKLAEECKKEATKVYPQEGLLEFRVNGKMKQIDRTKYTLENVDFSNPEQDAIYRGIENRRKVRYELSEGAARSNLDAAYYLRLMENPYIGNTNTFYSLTDLTPMRRLFAQLFGEQNVHVFVKPKLGFVQQQNLHHVLVKPIHQLAQEIFALKGIEQGENDASIAS